MKISILLLVVAAAATVQLRGADEAGFKSLLDGNTLGQRDGDPRFWKVEVGAIFGQTTADEDRGEGHSDSGDEIRKNHGIH